MSRVRIYNPVQDNPADKLHAGTLHSHGTILELDGQQVPYVRSIRLNLEVDSLSRVDVEVLVEDLTVELNADVHVNAVVQEPGLVEVERSDDGKTQRIRFVPSTMKIGPGGYPLKND